jgi:uncharacterized protein YbaP (TraB family)
MWKVSSGNNSIHLLGSLHLLKEEDYPLDARINEVYNGVDTLVFETDIAAASSPEFQTYMLSHAIYSEDKSLKKELSEPVYAELESFLSQIGIPVDTVNIFKPWFIGLTITTLQMIQLGYDPALGIDQHLYNKASEESKNTIGLETAEYQIDLLAALADIDQESFLRQIIESYEQTSSELAEIVTAWKTGDIEKMDILNSSLREYPEIYDALLVQRNHSWLAAIEEYLAEGKNLLVIVGAGHMPGDDGLISLLRKKGYRVSQY